LFCKASGDTSWGRVNSMDVARGEKFFTTRFEPTVASVGLTLWAVPVAAAVVGDRRTGTPRSEQTSQASDEMDEQDDQIAHHRIVAGREIPTNYERNNTSPATRWTVAKR
jgi:hypothetical protein